MSHRDITGRSRSVAKVLHQTPAARHPFTLKRYSNLEEELLAIAARFDQAGCPALAQQTDKALSEIRRLWNAVQATERAEREQGTAA